MAVRLPHCNAIDAALVDCYSSILAHCCRFAAVDLVAMRPAVVDRTVRSVVFDLNQRDACELVAVVARTAVQIVWAGRIGERAAAAAVAVPTNRADMLVALGIVAAVRLKNCQINWLLDEDRRRKMVSIHRPDCRSLASVRLDGKWSGSVNRGMNCLARWTVW